MGEKKTVLDISRALTPAVAVWPGDTPFEHEWMARLDDGATVNLSTIRMSVHAGTHADAPLHYTADGASIDQVPLLHFVGECRVIEVDDTTIRPEHVEVNEAARIPRVLFKTRHSHVADPVWDPALAPLLPETIARLAGQGVVLVGTDAPSVDPVESKSLAAHHALRRHGIVNLENLMLAGVAPGRYTLVALPLKLPGLDAAPVRAVLLPTAGL